MSEFHHSHSLFMAMLSGVDANSSTDANSNAIASTTEISTSEHSHINEGLSTETLISDLALILVLGALSTLLFKKLKQPIVLGYIVAGFLASPHMSLLPSVTNEANIEFWAQIGIIVLLFSLGLEFSFKKLMNVGGSAVITALVIVMGMMSAGFITGKLMDFGTIDSLFLGGMFSMSSTTIIIKAFDDLKIRQKKFASLVLAVLICEDLFAVVMMVILSSIAINNSIESNEMLMSIIRLIFFLVVWFTVGVFLLPTIFKRISRSITDEMLLVIAMGLCLLMAVSSAMAGFSMALGAFVMGSILAGTIHAERIEHVVKPVKDLFGAVFFISVGMMVNPSIIQEHSSTIAIFSAVVIIGMIVFGATGMLITGQPLKVAIQSGFSLTQIGEFAFIIASLGMSLGVLNPSIYPIVVAVSVITTFFTPYFIKAADPSYRAIEKILPERLQFLLNSYSKEEATSESKELWKNLIARYSWRIVLYASLITAIIIASHRYIEPIAIDIFGNSNGKIIITIATFIAMGPFLIALASPASRKSEYDKLSEITSHKSDVPLVVMSLFRLILACAFVVIYLQVVYSRVASLSVAAVIVFVGIFVFSARLRKQMYNIESRFMKNLNERELHRSGKENTLVSDLHMAYITVGYDCPFVGEKLKNSNLRLNYGVNIASITRGSNYFPIPNGEMRIFPGDQLAIIGTDEQIQSLLPIIEKTQEVTSGSFDRKMVEFLHFELLESSPLIGKSVSGARLRDDYAALLVSIQRGEEYIKPTGDDIFCPHDVIWIVGNAKRLQELKG